MEGTARTVPMVPGPEAGEEAVGELAERVGRTARAASIFGDPIERDGVTVIPVAKARWGFGSGMGKDARDGGLGGGGGGGVMLRPTGFIEVRKGKARYRPIVSPAAVAAGLIGAGVLAARVAARMLAR